MHKKRNLVTVALVLGAFFGSHALVVKNITHHPTKTKGAPQIKAKVVHKGNIPNFAAITDIPSRKQAFFDYLQPMISAENKRIRELRSDIADMDTEELKSLAAEYNVEADESSLRKMLLLHIDEIPSSLVLAQAAIESAWGTSRFAQSGNNLFGEWCFDKGCGIVPKHRPPHLTHEVRSFASAEKSVSSYMYNLNSHAAYEMLRLQRADQRARKLKLNGCYLAAGLQTYSQKGLGYVEMVKTMIRSNQLESNRKDCEPAVVAKPKSPAPSKNNQTKSAKAPSA